LNLFPAGSSTPVIGVKTLKDNISLFTPEVLDQISQVVVKVGHKLFSGHDQEEFMSVREKLYIFKNL
jgi:hypothetical protein